MQAPVSPDLDGDFTWLGVDRPLTLRELRGHVVILDFWTYCCVNCMHVLPVLRDLEERHKNDPVVVIGVHSAKFEGERDPERIRAAMERYGVNHPVVVDREMTLWQRFGVRSWPTLVVVRPDGRVAAIAPGEPDPTVLGAFVGGLLAEASRNGSLAKRPIHLESPASSSTSTLAFPGRVVASHDRLFISDSGNHRVLICDREGNVVDAIGSEVRGLGEGPFADAQLDDPQGLFLHGDRLYIADARAHVIHAADLTRRVVRRIAGTGELGAKPLGNPVFAADFALRSPWALQLLDDLLLFASAGTHQLGVMDLRRGTVAVFAGSGREALVDGSLAASAFAQPSGFALNGPTLFVADSETSAVRAVRLAAGQVETMVGTGLFDFGHVDGDVGTARLQHCLDVAWCEAGLVVADTYNNALRLFSRDFRAVSTLEICVDGRPLAEPGGISVDVDGSLLVADTNNHRIVRVPVRGDRIHAEEACAIVVRGAPPRRQAPAAVGQTRSPVRASSGFFSAQLAPVRLGPGRQCLELLFEAPSGFAWSDGAPWRLSAEVSRRSDLLVLPLERLVGASAAGERLEIGIEVDVVPGAPAVDAEVVFVLDGVLCDSVNHARCVPIENRVRVVCPLASSSEALRISVPMAPPEV